MQTLENMGCIYKITNKISGKLYIGQCSLLKYKDDKPYNYGINGRWSDHLYDAKSKTSPLHHAIREDGADNFSIKELIRDELTKLDALEANYIRDLDTLIPNGYNVIKHSRVKLRISTNIHERYIGETEEVEVKPIRNNGEYKLVYVYLKLRNNDDKVRFSFGQSKDSTFKEAMLEANKFIQPFKDKNIPIRTIKEDLLNDPLEKYRNKLDNYIDKELAKVRLAAVGQRCVVYISLVSDPGWKNQKAISFGGKTISFKDAYEIAKLFVDALIKDKNTSVIDTISHSQQQVAAN